MTLNEPNVQTVQWAGSERS